MTMKRGETLAGFTVLGLIGRGGMGEVYRARDTKLGREVALKVLQVDFVGLSDFLKRFIREAKVLASLNHPSIAALYDLHEVRGRWFLVMELVEGPTLAEKLQSGPLSLVNAISTFSQIADALASAHSRQIIHRDLKPGNLKFTRDGRIKVIDFGIARSFHGSGLDAGEADTELTRQGSIIGTPAYMSPEQACGDSLSPRCDIWSFGCCLFEALTGNRLFSAGNSVELFAKVVRDPPDWNRLPLSLPTALRDLVIQCVTIDPDQRLATIELAKEKLEGLRREIEETLTRRPLPTVKRSKFRVLVGLDAPLGEALKEQCPAGELSAAAEEFRELVTTSLERFAGVELAHRGQRHLLAFETPSDALLFCLALQSKISGREGASIFRPRMGVHSGELKSDGEEEAELDSATASGPIQETLELLDAAEPMQILVTEGPFESARTRFAGSRLAERTAWMDHGYFEFERLGRSWRLFEAGLVGVSHLRPPSVTHHARPRGPARTLTVKPLSQRQP